MSHALARERFGDSDAVGRDIVTDGVHHTIVGVLPAGVVELGGIRSRIWLPLKIRTPTRKGPFWLRGIGRLRAGVSIEMAARDLAGISRRLFPLWASSFRDQSATMTPFPLRDTILGDAPKRIGLFGGAVLLVLADCAGECRRRSCWCARRRETRNWGSVLPSVPLAAASHDCWRQRASCSRLRRGWSDSASPPSSSRWRESWRPELPHIIDASVDSRAMLFAAGASILSGLLVTVPALVASLSRARTLRVDSRRVGRDRRTSRLRALLVSAEFALALPLVASAFWFVQTIWRLQSVDPGFTPAGAVTLNVQLAGPRYADGKARAAFWQRLDDRARSLPGITAFGYGANIPPDDPDLVNNFDLIDVPARGGAEPIAPWNVITPGFLQALGVRLLEGREFTPAEYASGSPTALVSASWAHRYFPGQSAVGRKMVEGGCTTCPLTEVIGVVSDVKYQGLDGNADAVYQAATPAQADSFRLVARTAISEDEAIRSMTNTVHGIDADVLVEGSTLRARLGDALNEPRHWTALVGTFAAAAGTLAALGVFGLMSYIVRQQRREIGVRLALGARPRAMTWMVVQRGVRYALAGSIVGVALAIVAGTLAFVVVVWNPARR